MVTKANGKDVPDFNDMSLHDRSMWILKQLQNFQGTVVTDDEGRWLQLEITTSVVPFLRDAAPALTVSQVKKNMHELGKAGFYRCVNKGAGAVDHFIKLDEENEFTPTLPAKSPKTEPVATTEAATDDLDLDALLAEGGPLLERAVAELDDLRARVAQLMIERGNLTAENARLTAENLKLHNRTDLTVAFRDGLGKLRAALDA